MNILHNSAQRLAQPVVASLPEGFRMPSGRRLRGPIADHFEAFYRSTLRFSVGARLRSSVLAELYASWARTNDAPSMSRKQLKRSMLSIGHAHLRSNGIWFADVQLASDAPHIRDNFPALLPAGAAAVTALGRIDRLQLELDLLRREIVAADA